MTVDKGLLAGSTAMLVLRLLEQEDMYGYQMIETLRRESENVFELKAGTLYPLLHSLERKGLLESYEQEAGGARIRKYYRITQKGIGFYREKHREWKKYSSAVNRVMGGAHCEAT
ncbi:PadR family transcriptional regulator [Christensenella intestinihominis]|uniref:PadR family transcriptional regulator n=1 Tax=Christensenella intestinihominis TaxID=1851429 RepID=UPI00082F6DE2|nr:helix-turn-helix transcriptional regulator [Christensenella intestinihominis]